MNGLIVKEPFATQLVTGKKLTEFRTKPLPNDRIDESIYILNKGKILGTVTFMGSEKMGNLYKWLVLESKEFPVKFGVKPMRYKHKQGCVIWIKDVEVIKK